MSTNFKRITDAIAIFTPEESKSLKVGDVIRYKAANGIVSDNMVTGFNSRNNEGYINENESNRSSVNAQVLMEYNTKDKSVVSNLERKFTSFSCNRLNAFNLVRDKKDEYAIIKAEDYDIKSFIQEFRNPDMPKKKWEKVENAVAKSYEFVKDKIDSDIAARREFEKYENLFNAKNKETIKCSKQRMKEFAQEHSDNFYIRRKQNKIDRIEEKRAQKSAEKTKFKANNKTNKNSKKSCDIINKVNNKGKALEQKANDANKDVQKQ